MKPITISIDPETQEILDRVAAVHNMNRSEVVRYLILEADSNSVLQRRKNSMEEFYKKREAEMKEIERISIERRNKKLAEEKAREKRKNYSSTIEARTVSHVNNRLV